MKICALLFGISITIDAITADTEPPPGAELRAATSLIKPLRVLLIKGPSLLGKQYSIILSLIETE